MDKINRMKQINEKLSEAASAYYNTGVEIMSDHEYDQLYDELEALEKETGIILSGSRTQKVGFEAVSSLRKVRHDQAERGRYAQCCHGKQRQREDACLYLCIALHESPFRHKGPALVPITKQQSES